MLFLQSFKKKLRNTVCSILLPPMKAWVLENLIKGDQGKSRHYMLVAGEQLGAQVRQIQYMYLVVVGGGGGGF